MPSEIRAGPRPLAELRPRSAAAITGREPTSTDQHRPTNPRSQPRSSSCRQSPSGPITGAGGCIAAAASPSAGGWCAQTAARCRAPRCAPRTSPRGGGGRVSRSSAARPPTPTASSRCRSSGAAATCRCGGGGATASGNSTPRWPPTWSRACAKSRSSPSCPSCGHSLWNHHNRSEYSFTVQY